MPIESFTGLPGHGKTTLMVEKLLKEAAKKDPRPLYTAGIDGLKPGLATDLGDPRTWNDLDLAADWCKCDKHAEPHGHKTLDGALIFIDEAWKWFGHLQDAGRQATPKHVLDLAEHRHRGIDFVWTYQQPSQIFPFARGLCADHSHVVRRFGTRFVDVFKWAELNEDVKSASKRDGADRTTRALPKKAWEAYKSASVHTVKRQIPWKVLALPLLAVAAVALLWFAYTALASRAEAAPSTVESPEGGLPTPGAFGTAATTNAPRGKYADAEAYARAHTPLIATIPGSAPVFQGREVTADPQLFCMASGAGLNAQGEHVDATCACVTEQGTPYGVTAKECELVARRGAPYNPYKRESQRNDVAAFDQGSDGPGHADRSSSGSVMSAAQIGAYGDLAVPGAP